MSTWKCLYYTLVCCLGSHTLKWPVGVVFIGPNKILVIGEKLLLCGTQGSPVEALNSPVRLDFGSNMQVTVGAAGVYTDQSERHTGQSCGFSPPVPPGTSRWAKVNWCTR
jgi:hypothetical protein